MGNDRPPPTNDNGQTVTVVSLKGAGQIQRRVWRAFVTLSDAEPRTSDLAAWACPRWTGEPLHKQRIAMICAVPPCSVSTSPRRNCYCRPETGTATAFTTISNALEII